MGLHTDRTASSHVHPTKCNIIYHLTADTWHLKLATIPFTIVSSTPHLPQPHLVTRSILKKKAPMHFTSTGSLSSGPQQHALSPQVPATLSPVQAALLHLPTSSRSEPVVGSMQPGGILAEERVGVGSQLSTVGSGAKIHTAAEKKWIGTTNER